MTSLELMKCIGQASDQYVLEAGKPVQKNKVRSAKRVWLMAAVIAVVLLLAGCAVVIALRIQDMSIGKETYTQRFDDSGKVIDPVERVRDVLTMYGHNGDAIQLASKEWLEFLESCDPDHALSDNNPDHPEIPNALEYIYKCYTPEMAEKLKEIAAKYQLSLLEEWLPFQQYQSDIFWQETGVQSFLRPDADAQISYLSGMFEPPVNFRMEFGLTTDFLGRIDCYITCCDKKFFPSNPIGSMDLSQITQWDYTSTDGTKLLLVLSNKGTAHIISETEDRTIIILIYGNFSGSQFPSADEILTQEQVEQLADLFDYSIRPVIRDRAAVLEKLNASEEAHQAEMQALAPPEAWGDFDEYLKWAYVRPTDAQYTLYDINNDGKEELLTGSDGRFSIWVTIRDGEAQPKMRGSIYLCEGDVLEDYAGSGPYEQHTYYSSGREGSYDDLDQAWSSLVTVRREGDQWYKGTALWQPVTEITEEEALSIIGQYRRIELDWKPLMDYPLAEGCTLGEYLDRKDVRVSHEELVQIYRDYLQQRNGISYTHYRLLDINHDGVEELLLKSDSGSLAGHSDFYSNAYTYRYGRVLETRIYSFYLCGGGFLEKVTDYNLSDMTEMTEHTFLWCSGMDIEELESVTWNKATASWQLSWWEDDPVPEEQANAILNKYPRIDQGMQPIGEFLTP